MVYADWREMASFCAKNRKCTEMLRKLYQAESGKWVNANNLRTVCGVDRSEWQGFLAHAGKRCGADLLDKENTKSMEHLVNVRLTVGKRDTVKKILDYVDGGEQ